MSTISEYYREAELAFGAYANLTFGMTPDNYIKALTDAGMPVVQADGFSTSWRVVDQYDGEVSETYIDEFGQEHTFLNPTGLSTTVFESVADGKRYLAIRGTESSFPEWITDWATNIIDIGILGTAEHQAQYDALSRQVRKWLDDGILQPGFSVAGHSLGGFLATNLALEYAGDVSDTYLYNAPGVAGLASGLLLERIANALMPGKPYTLPPLESIHNVVATSDPVSEVGVSVAPPLTIQIESNINPIYNHSIATLTDSLAVYDLFARVDPSVSVETVGTILNAAANENAPTLETALAMLGALYGRDYPAGETSRDT
ncbi:MAG: hypothetical protein AB1772_13435, partial [Candidatus Zixiibacteriota bacterium]